MVIADRTDWESFSVRRLIGSDFTLVPIVFSADNSKAFMTSEGEVIVTNVSTGRWLHVLKHVDDSGNNTRVVGLHFQPSNKLTTYTESGTYSEWDVDSGSVLRSCDLSVPNPIRATRLCSDGTALVVSGPESQLCISKVVNCAAESLSTCSSHTIVSNRALALSDDFLILCDKLAVYLYTFDNKSVKKFVFTGKMRMFNGQPVAFVAAATANDVVVASLSFGRIMMWDKVSKLGIETPSRTVHWHRMAPSLVVTTFGSLVTGGHEGTIVKYSLNKSRNAMTPTFMPHMQAEIMSLSISEDSSLIAAVLGDNSVHIILLSTMTVLCSPKVLLNRHSLALRSFLPLTADPVHPGVVVTSARPGTLQWIDLDTGLTTDVVDAINENLQACDPGKDAAYTDVVAVALTTSLAVTAESRIGDEIPSNRLRFFRRAVETGMLSLEYDCDCGHRVLAVRIGLDSEIVLAVDSLGFLASWERRDDDPKKWHKLREARFKKTLVKHTSQINGAHVALIHNSQPHDVENEQHNPSDDGVLVIWRVLKGQMLREVHFYRADGKLNSVEWGPPAYSHLLLLSSPNYIFSFDTHSFSPLWAAAVTNPIIGVTSQYSFVCSDSSVHVWDESDGELSERVGFSLPDCSVTSAIGIGADSHFKVVFATDKGIMVLSRTSSENSCIGKETLQKKTPFSRLLSTGRRSPERKILPEETQSSLEILAGPSHALASVPLIATRFIRSCLLPAKNENS